MKKIVLIVVLAILAFWCPNVVGESSNETMSDPEHLYPMYIYLDNTTLALEKMYSDFNDRAIFFTSEIDDLKEISMENRDSINELIDVVNQLTVSVDVFNKNLQMLTYIIGACIVACVISIFAVFSHKHDRKRKK